MGCRPPQASSFFRSRRRSAQSLFAWALESVLRELFLLPTRDAQPGYDPQIHSRSPSRFCGSDSAHTLWSAGRFADFCVDVWLDVGSGGMELSLLSLYL